MANTMSPAASTTSTLSHPSAPLAGDRSLRNGVEQHILSEIWAGRLKPGDRLLEVELAGTLGVSLTPIREAFFRLVNYGQIVHKPRRGFYLASPEAQHVDDIYALRSVLEGLAASCAATRIRPDEVRELEELIAEGAQAALAGDSLRNAGCNARFHTVIVQAARHALLERAWQMFPPLHWLGIPESVPPVTPALLTNWVARHQQILDAIMTGNPQLAEREARKHIRISATHTLLRRQPQP